METIIHHPDRHLEDIEQKYSMYYDIYSLGVCMIEILLWKSLVVKLKSGEIGPSPLLEYAVVQDELSATQLSLSTE